MILLDKWSITYSKYTSFVILQGKVYNHKHFPDGFLFRSATIEKSSNRIVETSDGLIFVLGRIDPTYRRWLRTNNISYDYKNPVGTIK